MTSLPHDATDLLLAPVVLALDARIEELGRLDAEQLSFGVALESDRPDWTRQLREESLIRAVSHLIDCHGWQLSWDPRGLRVSHGTNAVVLGVPATFVAYLEGRVREGKDDAGAGETTVRDETSVALGPWC
jgi:hypothetical protein